MKKIIAVFAFVFAAGSVFASGNYVPNANAPRSSIPEQYKWDTTPLFKTDAAWEAAYKKTEGDIDALLFYKGKLSNPDELKNCMEAYVRLHQTFGRLSLYSNLKNVEDENVEKYQKMRQRFMSLAGKFNEKTVFMREEILKLQDVSSPKLADYKSYLDELRRRKDSLLGPEAEKVLAMAGDNLWSETDLNEMPSDIESVFKAATRDIQLPKIKDENGKEVQLTLSNYAKYRASKDRNVRKETVASFFAALKKYQNIFTAILGGEMKRDVLFAKARKYNRSVDAYLDRENISPAVIDNLINTVRENLQPLHRYIQLRKKILAIPDVHIYDLYTPLVPSVERDISYAEAVSSVADAMKPLGPEYSAVLADALDLRYRWTDVYPNKGKESGAFSSSIWGLHPYVKMNYMDTVDDMSTLAHEFGHAMHSYFNMKKQPYLTSGYSTLAAEIASTLNEMLLSNYLLEKYDGDRDMKLYLLGERIERIRTTVYRQTLFAEFERKLHEFAEKGTPLTAELFNKTYKDLLRTYYGVDFTIDENDDVEWAYIPHFYWKFYVYSYAAGLSSGVAMSENILKNGEEARKRYLAMLSAPATDDPIETIKKAGVDLTKPEAIKAAADLMNKTIEEMEKLVLSE